MSENKKANIRYSDMDIKQKREYQKLKKRESRQKMTEEKKEEERNNSKLGMENHRLELSDEALEYENISAKHRMSQISQILEVRRTTFKYKSP